MARKPTGNPRGRPKGTGILGAQTRLTVRIPSDLYQRLEAFAEGRHFARGTPQLAGCVRDALEHYLACPNKRQTINTLRGIEDTNGQTLNVPEPTILPSEYTNWQPENDDVQGQVEPWKDNRQPVIETEQVQIGSDRDNRQPKNEDVQEQVELEEDNRQPEISTPGFDTIKYFLGDLCRRGHDYAGTGQSLRRKADRAAQRECMACLAERTRKYRQRKREAQGQGQPG